GRREDEGAGPPRRLLQQSLQDRQQERGRLPGPGLRGADDVATGEDRGDRLFLDRGGSLVAEGVDRPEEDRFEAELVEGMLRVGCMHRPSYELIGLRVPIRRTRILRCAFPGLVDDDIVLTGVRLDRGLPAGPVLSPGPRGRASAEASDEIAGHGRRLEQRLAGDPRDPTDEESHVAALGRDLARVRIAIRVNRDELFRVFTHDLHAREGEGDSIPIPRNGSLGRERRIRRSPCSFALSKAASAMRVSADARLYASTSALIRGKGFPWITRRRRASVAGRTFVGSPRPAK